MKTIFVYDLEKHALTEEILNKVSPCVHDALGQPLEDACAEVPITVGHTTLTGWFILMSGQGPFIYWLEYEDRGVYGNAPDGRRDRWTFNNR